MKMHALLIVALLAVGTVQASTAQNVDLTKKVLGTWQLTKGVIGGTPMPAGEVSKIRIELTDGRYRLTGAESPDEGTWTVHRDQKPIGLDVTGTDGPNKGKTFLAIVKLHRNRMTVCYDLSGRRRPAKFESKKGTAEFLAVYRRVKP